MQRKKVGIVIFDDVEVLDFCGPFEGFSVMGHAPAVETLASVCTGSLLLGKAGFLDGVRGTTHWQALDLMAQLFPNDVDRTSHAVEQGKVVTSAGISAGIDMALIVVARHYGDPVTRATAQYMEYPYPESNARGVPMTLT